MTVANPAKPGVLNGWRWCLEDFNTFFRSLDSLPDGQAPTTIDEPFWQLILREVFRRTEGQDRHWISAQDDHRELLVLIPKGHAKTTVMAALAVFHMLVVHNPNVYIGAADTIQADEMYRFAKHFVESEPEIAALAIAVGRGKGGSQEIRLRGVAGFIRVLASDHTKAGGKRQGFNPTLALIDELHAHENDNLYSDMRSGLFKRNGLQVTITTQGGRDGGVLDSTRAGFIDAAGTGGTVERGLLVLADGRVVEHDRGRLTIARKAGDTSVMLEWSLRKDDDFTDMAVVKLANPASWVTESSLLDAFNSLRLSKFKAWRCNLRAQIVDTWIDDTDWDALFDERVPVVVHRLWNGATKAEIDAYIRSWWPVGTEVVSRLDMGRYRDCAALVTVGPHPTDDGLYVPRTIVWRSGGRENPVAYRPVEDAFRTIHATYRLLAAAWDPKYFDRSGEELENEGLAAEVVPQSPERMSMEAEVLRRDVLGEDGTDGVPPILRHDGDPILAAHVLAGVERDVGPTGFRFDTQSKSGPPIDALEALAGAAFLRGEMDDGGSGEPLVAFG